ncbi:MAG TPA: hypothetical protein VN838_01220 [Bradyrhizobium sp.]|nr:hypothetical protein [Bradyrhizobium sp.]
MSRYSSTACAFLMHATILFTALTGSSSLRADDSSRIYITRLSITNPANKLVRSDEWPEIALNEAVQDLLNFLTVQSGKCEIDAQGHSIPDTPANAQKLSTIFWDAYLSRTEKVDKIINEVMLPAATDGLIAGYYSRNPDASLSVRLLMIARPSKAITTILHKFADEQFKCKDPNNPDRYVLCDPATEELRESIVTALREIELLGQ